MNPAALRASRGVLLATFLGAMDSTVMGTIGPTVASRFHALVWEPWMITAFMLCTTLATPVFGRLADTTDNRRLYAVALTVFAAGSAWTALSPSMDFLLIGRIIQGLGAGGLFTMGLILLGRLFTGPTRATMQARQSAMWGIAAVLGPTLGGVAALGAGWRLLFAINVPLAWMAIRVMRAVELPPPDQQAPPLDRAGLALLTIVLVAVLALPTLWATGGAREMAMGGIRHRAHRGKSSPGRRTADTRSPDSMGLVAPPSGPTHHESGHSSQCPDLFARYARAVMDPAAMARGCLDHRMGDPPDSAGMGHRQHHGRTPFKILGVSSDGSLGYRHFWSRYCKPRYRAPIPASANHRGRRRIVGWRRHGLGHHDRIAPGSVNGFGRHVGCGHRAL